MSEFDPKKFIRIRQQHDRFEKRLEEVEKKQGRKSSDRIKNTVVKAVENLDSGANAFVIYGDPQSGKTEMMIALTAKLLDSGYKFIVLLVNDNIELLNQNLERFKRSGLNPSPKEFGEILDPEIQLKDKEWVVFCKKNAHNLKNLIDKTVNIKDKIIIDDEGDYGTPNTKVNKGKQSKINELLQKLIEPEGAYIGVTATPARLDLNRTFNNDFEKWVVFPPHDKYTGPKTFFPAGLNSENIKYNLKLLPDQGDDPKYLEDAMIRFFINVGILHLYKNKKENYSMLIHTSGKKDDHVEDNKIAVKVIELLKDPNHKKFDKLIKKIWNTAQKVTASEEKAYRITEFIVENIGVSSITVMNSSKKKTSDSTPATNPAALFTIIIGGNIVSRGVTFNNLLSMFFTRDAKHKIQQDTYIQRARMFGARGDYLEFFELSIPEGLFLDWHRCFVYHRLSLESISFGGEPPVWLEDKRISSAAPSSIKKSQVDVNKGEMTFDMFDYMDGLDQIVDADFLTNQQKLNQLKNLLKGNEFPQYLIQFIHEHLPFADKSIAIHKTRLVGRDTGHHDTLIRPRGLIGASDTEKFPNAIHHIMIHKNHDGKARVFYRHKGNTKFLTAKKTS